MNSKQEVRSSAHQNFEVNTYQSHLLDVKLLSHDNSFDNIIVRCIILCYNVVDALDGDFEHDVMLIIRSIPHSFSWYLLLVWCKSWLCLFAYLSSPFMCNVCLSSISNIIWSHEKTWSFCDAGAVHSQSGGTEQLKSVRQMIAPYNSG